VVAELAAMAPGIVQFDSFSWNRMLVRDTKTGEYEKTMELFKRMQIKGMRLDRFRIVILLSACASLHALKGGRQAQEQIMQTGCKADVFVGSSLIDMYAKCGSMEDAHRVFNKMPSYDVVNWTVLILGVVICGQEAKGIVSLQSNAAGRCAAKPVTFEIGF
jgi:pentatricopeptide repeat protein